MSLQRLVVWSCLLIACSDDANVAPDAAPREGECVIADAADAPTFVHGLGCRQDFDALASDPLDVSIPGARSVKVVLDRLNADALYFQNSKRYARHYDFLKAQLPDTLLGITSLSGFNATQYSTPDRLFLLGAVTYYDGPKAWVLELASQDSMTPEQATQLFHAVRGAVYFGSGLAFHPTSENVARTAEQLPGEIDVLTTDDLYAEIDYQPLNLGETVGQLRFVQASALAATYLSFSDLVVLDEVPNDISVVAGMITAAFQTPLSHVNILAKNRGTPNMGLRGAQGDLRLTQLEGKWVKLRVGALDWSIEEVTRAEADAYWAAHKPEPVTLPELDLDTSDLRDIRDVTVHTDSAPYVTRDALRAAVSAFGAKAANYSVFATDPAVPSKPGFAIPVRYYVQFMQQHGFFERVKALREDPAFVDDPQVRDQKLQALRDDMRAAELDPAFAELLRKRLAALFPGRSVRFRSSTNGEDLDGFPCAGCYDSHTADPAEHAGDQLAAALEAIRKTWATVWSLRTYEEREYHGIVHESLAMALLVHTNFPSEEANGVAITRNPFDPTENALGYYVNVQFGGDIEVVAPPPGVTSDSFIYQYDLPGQPIIYHTHSSLIPKGETVLSTDEVDTLGAALGRVHELFRGAYGGAKDYAMDVEFKLDDEADPEKPATLYIKQARPYPGHAE
jgi:pyruvate, water dikinase